MKLLFSFLSLVFLTSFQNGTLEKIRADYPTAIQSSKNTQAFVNLVEKSGSSNPVILGYKAAGEIMQAKFQKGESRKKMLYDGVFDLETLILKNPNEIELRLIRLSIQENLPIFLKYRKNIKEDKSFILKNYSKQNNSLKAYLQTFASQSKSFTASERAQMK